MSCSRSLLPPKRLVIVKNGISAMRKRHTNFADRAVASSKRCRSILSVIGVRVRKPLFGALLLNGFLLGSHAATSDAARDPVKRVTLSNGLRIIIVPDSLAPVVTVELSVLAGGNESPPEYPGMAHAQEHMAFRGCVGMTSDQTAALSTELGGQNNADTEENVTHYYATVPSGDLDIALQAQAACMRGIDDAEEEWSQERGAIEQEVAEDLSDPWYRLFQRVNQDIFAGTPYAQDPLGSKSSFDATTGRMLKEFQTKWYAPNNEILVISGDVNPDATFAKVKDLFGDLPSHALPPRPAVELKAVKSESFRLDSNLPNVIGIVAFRLPGTDSPDYAAIRVLVDVLSSPRGGLYKMESTGDALTTDFDLAETCPKASVGYGLVEMPAGANPTRAIHEMKTILDGYARWGIPEELVEAAKRSELASVEFQRNSIPGLAKIWSDALAAEGRGSPDEDVDAIRRVTGSDVNRVAAQYLDVSHAVVGTLIPSPARHSTASKRVGNEEKPIAPLSGPLDLPSWAADSLSQLKMPVAHGTVSDTVLNNGIRLIVRPDSTSQTILVRGSIKQAIEPHPPRNIAAVTDVLEGLYDYGTQSMGRLAFETALDDIAADETAGHSFSLSVVKENFSRGVQLLADNELHPAFRARDFKIVKRQTSRSVAGKLRSPGYRTSHALAMALFPPSGPEQLEVKPKSFGKVSLEEVRQCQARTVRPDLATIVIVGDVTPEEARSVVERWFGNWKADGPTPRTVLPPVPMNKAASVEILDPGTQQDSVIIAELLDLDRFNPEYYALQLGNTVLGGNSEASRLYHDLRQVTGYVYSVDLDLDASATRAVYSITYGADPENTLKAKALVERDIEQMRTSEVSANELHQAKAFLLRQIPLSESSEEEVAEGLLARAEVGLPLDEPVREVEKYLNLTAGDVREAFAKRIRPADFVQVVRGPARHAESPGPTY
jgi:zinc protease